VVFSVFRKSGFYPAFTLDTEARGLLPFYAILVQLDTFTVLRQNALTFTLSPAPYRGPRRARGGAGGRYAAIAANILSGCPLSAFPPERAPRRPPARAAARRSPAPDPIRVGGSWYKYNAGRSHNPSK
jgi:hypothetical protein